MKIAVLEDDPLQNELMRTWLQEAGYGATPFLSGAELLSGVKGENFDVIMVDWELPDISGVDVVKRFRNEQDWQTPILFVTNRNTEEDVVTALNAGADDFMVKPPRKMELLARIEALHRRSDVGSPTEGEYEFTPYKFDIHSRKVSLNGETIQLTNKEFDLALFLFRNKGRLLSRAQLLEQVWGQTADINTRTVDTHASLIRQKLNLTDECGWRLNAVYGHGYRLEKLHS